MTKTQIRMKMRKERNSLLATEQTELNKSIYKKLYDLDVYHKSSTLFTYVSFQSEINTIAIIDQAFREKKQIYIPRVEGKEMEFYKIDSMDSLSISSMGIKEPYQDETKRFTGRGESLNHKEMQLMFLPGLAFDILGNRIGYGAGYYDRYLQRHSKDTFIKIAFAYEFQILDKINAENHDVKADIIITPKQIVRCDAR